MGPSDVSHDPGPSAVVCAPPPSTTSPVGHTAVAPACTPGALATVLCTIRYPAGFAAHTALAAKVIGFSLAFEY